MEAKDALPLFLSVQAFLLAAATFGVTLWRSRIAGEDAGHARILARWSAALVGLLSLGGLAAWFDLYARCATKPSGPLEVTQAGVILVAVCVLPWVAYQVQKGAA